MYNIGIDVGGTGIQIGVVDKEGNILSRSAVASHINLPVSEQVKEIAECAMDAVRNGGFTLDDIDAVGAGVPSVVDKKTGHVVHCNNMGWKDLDFAGEFRKVLDKPVYIGNDADVAALAENMSGVSKGADCSVMITLGTGVGSGIIMGGKVWCGSHGVGGELGHTILKMGGIRCSCGNRGCLERYCSATGVITEAKDILPDYPDSAILVSCGGDTDSINAKMVIDAAKAGDEAGKKVFEFYVDCLAQAIANVINFIDPEVIVLGGGVSKAGSFLLDAVRREVQHYVLYKEMPYARIELAKLGPDAGIIGAAMLCLA